MEPPRSALALPPLFIIFSAIIGPFVGNMVSSAKPRRVILGGSLILGVGLALCSLTQTWWQFYIFFSLITAVGLGAAGWVPHTTIIQQWFKEKRGLATGIISAGVGIGILICVPSAQYLIIQLGWRMAYRIMAVFIPLVVISLAILFLKRPPQIASHQIEVGISLTTKGSFGCQRWMGFTVVDGKRSHRDKILLASDASLLGSLHYSISLCASRSFFCGSRFRSPFGFLYCGDCWHRSPGGKILWGTLSDKIGREITYTMGNISLILGMLPFILFNLSPS